MKIPQELINFNTLQVQLGDAHQYLDSTDYVVIKIAEAKILGQDTSLLLEEYQEVLGERQRIRNSLDQLEKDFEESKQALLEYNAQQRELNPIVEENITDGVLPPEETEQSAE